MQPVFTLERKIALSENIYRWPTAMWFSQAPKRKRTEKLETRRPRPEACGQNTEEWAQSTIFVSHIHAPRRGTEHQGDQMTQSVGASQPPSAATTELAYGHKSEGKLQTGPTSWAPA